MFIKRGDAKFVGIVNPDELTKEQKEKIKKSSEDKQKKEQELKN